VARDHRPPSRSVKARHLLPNDRAGERGGARHTQNQIEQIHTGGSERRAKQKSSSPYAGGSNRQQHGKHSRYQRGVPPQKSFIFLLVFLGFDAKHIARLPGSIQGLATIFKKAKGDNQLRREQFTFYRSYYDALKNLPEKERAKVLFAILEYALDEQEQNNLEGVCAACFLLIRPTLDSGRIKAANRKNKAKTSEEQNENKAETNEEQTKNKTETRAEQNRKEKEKEKEREVEKEREIEVESEYDSITPNPSYDLTDDELRRLRQEQQDVETAAKRVGLPVSAMSDYDTMDNLRAEHGADNLLKAIGRIQGAAEKCRSWRYISGILRKEKTAGYTWAERAAESGGRTAGDEQVLTRNPFALQSLKCRGSVT
jgi:hypothetical protein